MDGIKKTGKGNEDRDGRTEWEFLESFRLDGDSTCLSLDGITKTRKFYP